MEKSERYELRLTPMEKHLLFSAAAAAGVTVSTYVLAKLGLKVGESIGDAILESWTKSTGSPKK